MRARTCVCVLGGDRRKPPPSPLPRECYEHTFAIPHRCRGLLGSRQKACTASWNAATSRKHSAKGAKSLRNKLCEDCSPNFPSAPPPPERDGPKTGEAPMTRGCMTPWSGVCDGRSSAIPSEQLTNKVPTERQCASKWSTERRGRPALQKRRGMAGETSQRNPYLVHDLCHQTVSLGCGTRNLPLQLCQGLGPSVQQRTRRPPLLRLRQWTLGGGRSGRMTRTIDVWGGGGQGVWHVCGVEQRVLQRANPEYPTGAQSRKVVVVI